MKENDQELFDNLHARFLNTRKARSAKPTTNVTVEPEIHVHVDMPEQKKAEPVHSPKKWVFKHKYDGNNKLIETTATCE